MEIILLERIQNLGDLGDTVDVANGYARNYLIPQRKAMRATDEAKAEVEARRAELAREESKRLEVAQARADLAPREISLTRLVSESGVLYGSVAPADIAEAMTEAGANIEKSEVILPDGPIKQPGESEVEIVLHAEVRFALKVIVLADAASPQPAVAEATEAEAESSSSESPTESTSESTEESAQKSADAPLEDSSAESNT